MKATTELGAIPANVFENMRPIVIAGFAKLVDEQKKYAAVIYAATAAGVNEDRSVLANRNMTSSKPKVAMTSENRCGPEARWCVEIDTAAKENMTLAAIAPLTQPAI